MKHTDNFQMNKPEPTDYYDIDHFNDNIDIIDEELQANKEHRENQENPHGVNKKQLGLDKVDNTSDADKPISTSQQQAIDNCKITSSVSGSNPTASNSTNAPFSYLKNDGYIEQKTVVEYPNIALTETSKGVETKKINCSKGSKIKIISSKSFSKLRHTFFYTDGSMAESEIPLLTPTTEFTITADTNNIISCSIELIGVSTTDKVTLIAEHTVTPDTPIEIKGLGDSGTIDVKTCGKNLLKVEPKTVTANNCTFTFNEDGSITANGTNPNDWIANVAVGTLKLKAGTYTISQNVTGTTNPYLYVVINGEWYTLVSNKSKMFTLTEDTEVIVRVGVYNKATVTNATIYPQLELGEVVTPYEPYTETQALIPISAPLYDGDYIEVFADGSGQIYRKMGSITYDGSNDEGWYQETTRFYAAKIADATQCDTSTSGKKAYSNQLKLVYTGETSNAQNDNSFTIASTKNLYLRINSITDISSLRTHLSSNPLHVVYTLDAPTTEPLTAEQIAEFKKLQTFKGVTHINADGEVTVRYYCNNDSGDTVGMLHEMVEDIEDEVAELPDKYADKAIYGDDEVSYGRKVDSSVGLGSFAFGNNVTASTDCAHAEGTDTTASGLNSHAEGFWTTASGSYSHAEGNSTTASGSSSHAEGNSTTAFGSSSHAEGKGTKALGNSSHAEGRATQALENQHAQGHYNDTSLATMNSSSGASSGTAFVIGNGSVDTASNAFRITGNGEAIGKASFASTGADYAEYFEWRDGNPDNEDRVGYFVTFAEGNLIKKATDGDYVLGIVSGMPCVIGNNDECWMKQFELDEWGRYIYETHSEINEETGEEKEYTFYKVNPDYDSSKEYIHRKERPEWSAVGMIGVLSVYDDGTCQVNGYCKCTNGGIATACERGIDTYRVIARVTDNIVKIVLKS